MNTRTRLTFVVTAILIVLLLGALPAFAKGKDKDKGQQRGRCYAKQQQMKIKKWSHKGDFDQDGLKNIDEFRCGTNPRRADTDKDGIIDGLEDPDGDGLVNVAEIDSKTNPCRADTDKDGIKDGDEDADNDGLTNGQEYLCDTNPRCADTDKDGIKDADENPDADGLTNAQEFAQGCDPLDSDSNDDGVLDGQEVVVPPVVEAPVVSEVQADGTVVTGDAGVGQGGTAIATVDWFDQTAGRAGLMASARNYDYQVLVDSSTQFVWAAGVTAAHEPGAFDLIEGAVVTDFDVTYPADGELLAKKIVLIPSPLAQVTD
jgi:type II secretory pathway pseudopilin PulG